MCSTKNSISNASKEELKPGDVIFYWNPLFVAGNPMGRMTEPSETLTQKEIPY
jgi:hypothetical protein